MASEDTEGASRAAYSDLKRLTPTLAAELDHLRASLREHNLWLQRYGASDEENAMSATPIPAAPLMVMSRPEGPSDSFSTVLGAQPLAAEVLPPLRTASHHPGQQSQPGTPRMGPGTSDPGPEPGVQSGSGSDATMEVPPSGADVPVDPPAFSQQASPPPYSVSDVPRYSSTVRDEVLQRRDQLVEWLREGEELLRDYSARFVQLATELHLPADDVLGTWSEAASDNALPDYTRIEPREELMVGSVGEVPPSYRASATGS